jgi:hypothetical protein
MLCLEPTRARLPWLRPSLDRSHPPNLEANPTILLTYGHLRCDIRVPQIASPGPVWSRCSNSLGLSGRCTTHVAEDHDLGRFAKRGLKLLSWVSPSPASSFSILCDLTSSTSTVYIEESPIIGGFGPTRFHSEALCLTCLVALLRSLRSRSTEVSSVRQGCGCQQRSSAAEPLY